jgi:hypothetical protein
VDYFCIMVWVTFVSICGYILYIYLNRFINADFMPMGIYVHSLPSVGYEDHMHSIY